MADDEDRYLDDAIEDPALIVRYGDQTVEQHPIEQLERVRARRRMARKKSNTYTLTTGYAVPTSRR